MSESAPEFIEDAEAEQMLAGADAEAQEEPGSEQREEERAKPAPGPNGFPPNTPVAQMSLDEREAYWKFNSRKWEKDAKANSAAAAKYAEFEDSQKTEQQRLADRAEAAEQRAVAAEIRHARLVAAATHDIPLDLLDRLGGTTEDEINEAAEQLAAAFESEVGRRLAAVPAPTPEPEYEYERPARTRPVESLTPGALPAGEQPLDGNDFLRALAGRRN